MTEPSVLDLVRSWLDPRVKNKIRIPEPGEVVSEVMFQQLEASPIDQGNPDISKNAFPLFSLSAFLLFLTGQASIEFVSKGAGMALGFFFLATISLGLAWKKGEWDWEIEQKQPQKEYLGGLRLNTNFILSMVFGLFAFLAFGRLEFNLLNIPLWVGSIFFFFRGLMVCPLEGPSKTRSRILSSLRFPWNIKISAEVFLAILLILIILFFRTADLSTVPGEPFSDHAEKLLDVKDVLDGELKVYFPRNTGREFLQFFLTAVISSWTNLGLSFMSLKLGTVLIGLFGLPFFYFLALEIGGRRLAFFTLFLAGISYWLNVTSRIGLRFPLYPSLAAPTIYFFIRGLRRGERNSLLLSGIFLGLGLHGYSPSRIVPIAIILGCLLFYLKKPDRQRLQSSFEALFLVGFTSFLVFLPLARYFVAEPMMFSYRALTRMTGLEAAISDPVALVFFKNNLNALLMFNVDNGGIWVHSIPGRPALDLVSGALFLFGLIVLGFKLFKQRDWVDLYILLLIPVFLLPSTLSVAFPSENPSLNRTGAAAISVFIIAAMGLDMLLTAITRHSRMFAMIFVSLTLVVSGWLNYDLVFHQFKENFYANAWNTSEIGEDVRYFTELGNQASNAYVIPFPHWVDTRLVGIQAGFPERDFALAFDQIDEALPAEGNKLFIFKEDDQATLDKINTLFPDAFLELRQSKIPDKNYWIARVH